MPLPRAHRARRLLVALLATAALPLAVLALPSAAGAEGARTTTVYVARPTCSAPAPGHAACFAEELVAEQVPAGSAAARATPVRTDAGAGPAGGYTPAQVAAAYGVDPGTPSTQVVALVDAYHSPRVLGHLNAFDAHYGLPAETQGTFRVVAGDGGSRLPTRTNAGWASETDLDVQAVRGLCHTCKILLVEADGSGLAALGQSVATAARHAWRRTGDTTLHTHVISNSYGGSERASGSAAYAADYRQPGIAVLASTGDSGWFDWDRVREGYAPGGAVNVPAALGAVVGVGGTSLTLDGSGARSSETVWNRDGNLGSARTGGATGGGCSERFAANAAQRNAPGYATLGCSPGKGSAVAVAALGDPYTGYDVFTTARGRTGFATLGGTSLSAPLVAALWGLAGGPQGVDYPVKTLYHSLADHRGLYDVTTGGNALCGTASKATCQQTTGTNPNTQARFAKRPVDCQFAWAGHPSGTADAQCRARAGLDGPSGVGVPSGLSAFALRS